MPAISVSLTDKPTSTASPHSAPAWSASNGVSKRLSYPSVILVTGLHAGALIAVWYVIAHGVTARHWFVFAAMAVATVACVTVGYHRLGTHGGFKAPSWVRAVLLFGAGMSLQGTAKEWVANHRVHLMRSTIKSDSIRTRRWNTRGSRAWRGRMWVGSWCDTNVLLVTDASRTSSAIR